MFTERTLSSHTVHTKVLTTALGLAFALGLPEVSLATGACTDPTIATLNIFALGTNNTLHSLAAGSISQSSQVRGIDGSLIGIDFRVSDGNGAVIYGVTDTGKIYQIDVGTVPYGATLLSSLAPRFAGGYQALADFNPTTTPSNALRLIGSNDQNFAVTGAALNQTVVQTPLAYARGDVYAQVDPNITAGAYDNNTAGARVTTFYMIDYDLDTLVTINDRNAAGSSNTGGGQLKTVGPLVDAQGNPLNFAPAAGLDIVTNQIGVNTGIAVSGQDFYCIDLADVNPNLPIGTQQKMIAEKLPDYSLALAKITRGDGLIDVAVNPFAPPAPANQADIAVAASGTAGLRGNVNYLVSVRNLGPATASEASLTSSPLACSGLPNALACRVSTSQGTCAVGRLGNRIACSFGDLPRGAEAIVRINGFSSVPAGDITSTFTAISNTLDPQRANNSATVTITLPEPVLNPPQ